MQGFSSAPGTLTLNLGALRANYRFFKSRVGAQCAVAAAVKANGYGIGVREAVNALREENCPLFFVATPDEALELKSIDEKISVAVLGGLGGARKDVSELFCANNIMPVLNTVEEIKIWHDLAKQKNTPLPAIIHLDSGMNRLGLSIDECEKISLSPDTLSGIDIQYVMSHYACSDELDHPLNSAQIKQFETMAAFFPQAKKSLANSSGIIRYTDHHYDMVRPGFSLYGGNPTPETTNPMQAVADLKVRILQIRHCKKGESIGYGATHVFEKDTMTATLGFGYADGFHRAASNKVVLYWQGEACPVIGRVSMDLVTIDLSQIKGQPPMVGDEIEVLGPHQDVDQLAAGMGTIGYEILTSLGPRYRRLYV